MKIVAVINYKGGVGKTSLTANLAAELAWRNYKLLMVDLDPQSSLTFSFITPDAWETSLVHTPKRVADQLKGKGQLDMICSHLGLINVDLELATKLGGASLSQAKKNFINIHRRLADGLSELGSKKYDLVLIDCPPNFNIVTKTAIIASDYILVPARPDYLSTLGIDYLIRNVNGLIKDYNDFAGVDQGDKAAKIDPRILGVVFTMIQEYGSGPMGSQRPFMDQVKRLGGIKVFSHYIKRNDSLFADAPQYGVPVVLHGYSSGSHQSVVDGLEGVTEEFGKTVGLW
jgi:chromosome partitioning protein